MIDERNPSSTKRTRPGQRWGAVRATTASSKIVSQVRAAVFAGRLRAGERLGSEMELAEDFGVSRATVRDALRALVAAGVVEVSVGAKGGARIARGNLDAFADALAIQLKLVGVTASEIMEAQVAVEATTAELAAGKATPEDLERLSRLLAEAKEQAGDPRGFTESSFAFHVVVAEASHNSVLVAQLKALRDVVWPQQPPPPPPALVRRVLAAHEELFRLIRAGDGPGARRSMCEHLEGIRSRTQPGAASKGVETGRIGEGILLSCAGGGSGWDGLAM